MKKTVIFFSGLGYEFSYFYPLSGGMRHLWPEDKRFQGNFYAILHKKPQKAL
ncbi:MAG: hypothetical protein NC124_16770 [Clostridium sp.]|nr:hypothetical protein [Bacillota bacterium]MCM1500118.1 hypothetical protein [Clostridium sp.]